MLGKSHPATAESILNLAALRAGQKRCDEGVSLSREGLAMTRQFLPERHERIATAALGLAGALRACGRGGEGQPLVFEALQIRTELMPSVADRRGAQVCGRDAVG
jgi:hypothetical protein